MQDDVVIVLSTAPVTAPAGRAGASALARQLVAEGLCACVNVVPGVESFYRWRGAVECGSECLLIVKTTRDRLAALERRLRELHPYEVPELLELPVAGGAAAYLDWVRSSVGPDATGA